MLKTVALAFVITLGLFGTDFDWNLPNGFPKPAVPSDNPMSAGKVEVGRYLFYDKRMSVNAKESCGSCHRQELASPTAGLVQKEQPAKCIRAAR